MYIAAIAFTLAAWVAGAFLDANIGNLQFSLYGRIVLPVLAMGLCILRAVKENKYEKNNECDKENKCEKDE